ncbi:MAG: NAD(P)-dependent oxidoreductase [Chloroflexota bacterium]
MRVGFIGLGRMGAPMALNTLRGGHAVAVHDVRREAAAELEAARATWAASAAELAASVEVLVTMLPGPPQVEAVMLGAGGAFMALPAGATWIDMSTSTPAAGRRAAALRPEVAVVDAPVSGMVKGAVSGRLQIFAGGDAADVARVRPVLDCMGDPERIFHVGPRGAGYAVKLAINLLWFVHVAAAAEVLEMGVRAGVDLDVLRSSLAASPASSLVIERDILPVWQGDYDESFTLDLVTKDLGLAVDLGRETGTPMEVSALVEQLHRRARALYGDKAGELAVVKLYEDATGTLLRPAGAPTPTAG